MSQGVYMRHEANEHRTIAGPAGVAPGTLLQYNGSVWLSQNMRHLDEGEAVAWRRQIVVEITKNAAGTTFSDGAPVGWDATNRVAVASLSGDFDCGNARGASGSSDTTVYVELTAALASGT